MPTILQINECLNLSTGKIAQTIGEAALKNGWKSYIAYSSREPLVPSKSKVITVGNVLDPYLHYIENMCFDREGLSSRFATRKLIAQIREIKPDVVHLHNIHDHWLNYQQLFEYLNQTDIKVVWTFHDCWAFTGHCFHFVTQNCERWKTGCYKCPLVHQYPNTFLDRSKKNYELKKLLFSGCENLTIVPVSQWMEDFVKESFLKDKQIHVIKNGVDLKTFRPTSEKKTSTDSKFRILAVSNVWNEEKGIEDIYQLRKSLSDDYIITIVGLTSSQVTRLPSGILGIERTQNVQELVDLYSASNVLINPTYADTFPTVNLEALACGTPVITYKTGGSPEAIDEKTGVVILQGNIEAMAESIRRMKENPLSREDCRKKAEECFDMDKCFEEYVRLYEEVIK